MRYAVTKTHLTPMLAKAGATQGVACTAQLRATGTMDLWTTALWAVMPSIGIVQTQDKVT